MKGNSDNMPGGHLYKVNPDDIDIWYKLLPEDIRHYLLFEAVGPWHPHEVLQFYEQNGSTLTLELLKSMTREQTRELYGDDHPQA